MCAFNPELQVLLHIRTEKGMGYPPAMAASDKYHGVAKFNVATGKQHKGVSYRRIGRRQPSALANAHPRRHIGR